MKNIKIDCHVHTIVSPDSNTQLKAICNSACEKDISSIIVTNHFEYYSGEKDGRRGADISFIENSLKEIEECKTEFEGKLEILFGMELGQAHQWIEGINKITKSYPFDYLIGSLHKVNGIDLKNWTYSKENLEKQSIKYLDALYDMVKNSEYDCVGHLDLIKRYAARHNEKIDLIKLYEGKITEILKVVIERGKGIEINTSGLRQEVKETMPSTQIIQLYKNLGGKIITIGSDSHNEKDVGEGFEESINILKKVGFKQIAIYRARKPYFYDI